MTSESGARSKLRPVMPVLEENQNKDQDIEVLSISDVYHVDIPSDVIRLLQELHLDNDSSSPKEIHNHGTMVAIKTTNGTCWYLMPLLYPEPYSFVLFLADRISQIYFNRKTNLVGFTFRDTDEETNKHLIMRLASASAPNDPSRSIGTLDELDIFLNLCSKMRPNLEPIEMFNRSYIKKFLTDPAMKLLNAEEIVEKISKETQDAPGGSVQFFGELRRAYFRPYVYFMLRNHHLDKKAIKKQISSVDNIPEFMKSLSWTDEEMPYTALCSFLLNHACYNLECDGFSLLRCGGCDFASYCNVECQEKGSEVHNCEYFKQFRTRIDDVPKCIENILEKLFGKKVSISLHSFSKSLMTRIYRSFFGALKNRYFLSYIQTDLFKREDSCFRSKSNLKMLDLVKKGRDTQSFYTIRTQLEQTYGRNNKVVKMMKPS